MSRDPGCHLCEQGTGSWRLGFADGAPAAEGTKEALLTLGNGYLATRGAKPEAPADGVHYPGTYVAGVYNRLVSRMHGREREDESLVNLPAWAPVTFRPAGGAWAARGTVRLLHQHTVLDLRRAVLSREAIMADAQDRRTRLRQRSLVSMAHPHLAALETVIIPENWSGRLEVRSGLDGRVRNSNAAAFSGLAGQHLTGITCGAAGEAVWLCARTSQSRVRIAECARTVVHAGTPAGEPRVRSGRDTVSQEFTIDVNEKDRVTVAKTAAVFTSQDRAISEPLLAAREEVAAAGEFGALAASHAAAWEQLWRRFQLRLPGGGESTQRAVNAHIYHLLASLSPHTTDLDAGVPARGLHGEGYQGHVFWDEIFVFPFLNLRLPQLTRSLLRYRYRRLDRARRIAAGRGAKGAAFPWQSGSDGREETPRSFWNPRSRRWMPDNSWRQHHVSLAIAYNVWHYWEVTADLGFMAAYGVEMLTAIARFWVSLATYDPARDRYDIRGVMGPDEFHDGYPGRPGQGIDNSAYVNVMVAWTLVRASDACRLLGEHHGDALWQRLGLTPGELDAWDHLSRRLTVPFLASGMMSQFEGYEQLAGLDWAGYRARYGHIGRLDLILEAEGDTTNRYQASKQADVLMLFYLFTAEEITTLLHRLGYPFDPATIPATADHYLARTSHGSTLSRIAHAWVLARTDRRRSWQMLREALGHDLADTQGGTTREGIHLGAMAGTLDILQRCYTGIDTRDGILWLSPLLPTELGSLEFEIHFRDQWITIHLDQENIRLHALPGPAPPVTIDIRGARYQLAPGATLTVALHQPPARTTGSSPGRPGAASQ